jgi:long-chain acyl-CoA synthetase
LYTFAQPLGRAVAIAAGFSAVVCQDSRRTYAELGSRCRRLAGAMRKLGVAPHDRVGVIALNSDRYLELYLGLPAAGYVLVPVNSRLAPAEMRAILADAGVSLLFADSDYPGAAGVGHVLTMPDDYEDLIASADELPLGEGVTEDDLAALFYTSGTTGAAKGAMHTHRSLVSSALHFMATWPFDQQTRWLVASPMFQAVTHTLLVPTMLAAAASAQLARPRNVSSLGYLSHGASPISAETLRRTRQAFPGAELLHVYGTTETTPITTLLPREERLLDSPLIRSCGQPAVGVEVRVVDKSQADLPPGAVGELAVRSPSVMNGYWCKPQSTAEVMRGDWYLTGDLGYRDEDSYLYLVDRVKDMIVSGGENIYSTEVEDALATHRAVEEVAVFGVPDPRWGETVYAVVFGRIQVTPDELVAHCRERIAGFKIPRCVELRTQPLPKSAAGKILKRDLREPHWAGRPTQVSGG